MDEFTTTIRDMAEAAHVLTPDVGFEDHLDFLRLCARDLDLDDDPDRTLDEATADRIAADAAEA